VSPWRWAQSDVVHLVVTTVGADGERRCWYADLHTGPEHGETIRLPAGTQIVRIERYRRVRVELGRLRAQHRYGEHRALNVTDHAMIHTSS
jgi:hypothetical protein